MFRTIQRHLVPLTRAGSAVDRRQGRNEADQERRQRSPPQHLRPTQDTVLALGYDAMMCWKCVLYYSLSRDTR
ncbi:hypothetical protein CDV31_015676 [Fusarium ambrosium]|uniref:Uncharacterized protein n=1 Tax=Fusarium ambrosium TaxID=131363 RepID=A0A428SL37_9HYPO|nr:hypothetical protein CDV31_015676 [Fusarium ambrosium]